MSYEEILAPQDQPGFEVDQAPVDDPEELARVAEGRG